MATQKEKEDGDPSNLKAIKAMLKELRGDIAADRAADLVKQAQDHKDALKNTEQRLTDTINNQIAALSGEIAAIKNENKELKELTANLNQKVSQLESRILLSERDNRRLNIVASGIDFESPQEGYAKLQQIIEKATDRRISVTGIRTVNATSAGKKKIVAVCSNLEDKRCIMRLKKNFTDLNPTNPKQVYVDDDLPFEDREVQRRVREIAKELRAKGKDVLISFRKIRVDGEWQYFNEKTNSLEGRSFRKEM